MKFRLRKWLASNFLSLFESRNRYLPSFSRRKTVIKYANTPVSSSCIVPNVEFVYFVHISRVHYSSAFSSKYRAVE